MKTPAISDVGWLAGAARLAQRARPLSRPNPAVGALIIRNGRIVGRGWTQAGGRPHAEAVALEQAGQAAKGATLYATLEPCAHQSLRGPSCASSIAASSLARCVYALPDPDPRTKGKGHAIMAESGMEVRQIETSLARASLSGYLTRKSRGRPFVTLKLAISLDGCIALASGESQWITGEIARAHVHSRRALQDAVLVGGGTWRADAPRLDIRLPGRTGYQPGRIILSRQGKVEGAKALASPEAIHGLSTVQYLYIEGGAQTATAFLAADLVDRLDIYRAPIIIGGGKPAITDIGLASLAQAHGQWTLAERRQLGSDTYEAYERMIAQPAKGD